MTGGSLCFLASTFFGSQVMIHFLSHSCSLCFWGVLFCSYVGVVEGNLDSETEAGVGGSFEMNITLRF